MIASILKCHTKILSLVCHLIFYASHPAAPLVYIIIMPLQFYFSLLILHFFILLSVVIFLFLNAFILVRLFTVFVNTLPRELYSWQILGLVIVLNKLQFHLLSFNSNKLTYGCILSLVLLCNKIWFQFLQDTCINSKWKCHTKFGVPLILYAKYYAHLLKLAITMSLSLVPWLLSLILLA